MHFFFFFFFLLLFPFFFFFGGGGGGPNCCKTGEIMALISCVIIFGSNVHVPWSLRTRHKQFFFCFVLCVS